MVEGYRNWLATDPSFVMLGHASDPVRARGVLHALPELPQVLLLDYSYPDGSTIIDHLHGLRELAPLAAMVVITSYDRPDILRTIDAAGVDGLLTKDDNRECFLQCITAVAAGNACHSQRVRAALRTSDPVRDALEALTPAQRSALPLLASGMPDKEVAARLAIAASTLDGHRTAILDKLRQHGFKVFSKAELAVWHARHC